MIKETSFIDDLRDVPGLNDLRGRDLPGQQSERDDEGDVDAYNEEKPTDKDTFPCESCGGTGIYRGVRLHQPESKCFACGGKGFFKKSYKDRLAARQKSAQRKASKIEQAQAAFEETYPGLIAGLTALTSWNSFAADLIGKFNQYGSLTDNQASAAQLQVEKAAARDAERAAAKEQRAQQAPVVLELDKLKTALDTAASNGLKKPKLRFDGFAVSVAPLTGKNPGALYIKGEQYGDYLGKIVNGKLLLTREAEEQYPTIAATITQAIADPVEAAKAYGRRSGVCSCCGRELTDPVSVEQGIGPVCITKFGF